MTVPVAAGLAVALVLLVLLREVWLRLWVPAVALALAARGRRRQARALLERVISRPSLAGEGGKAEARYRLAWLFMQDAQIEEAAAQCRAALAARLRPAMEANLRRRLADCLESSGDLAGAQAERDSSAALVREAPDDADVLIARARILKQQEKHVEACAAYAAALEKIPEGNRAARVETLLQLSLSSFNAGRPEDAARHAEAALALEPSGPLKTAAHDVAGLAYSALGRLEDSERHRMEALRLAMASGNAARVAHCLIVVAACRQKRGKLAEAIQACEKACSLSTEHRRLARLTEGESLRIWGRFDQARTALEQARRAAPFPEPAAERRSQGTLALAQGHLEVEAERPADALRYLDEAAGLVGQDEKLGVWLAALRAWALAAAGDREAAAGAAETVRRGAAAFSQDRGTQQMCAVTLGRALLALDDPAAATAELERYLSLDPEPAFKPQGLFYLGECRVRLGDTDAARSALRDAAESGVDTHYTRRAQRRLTELET